MIETPVQPRIGQIFNRLIANQRLASSYLFYGPAGSGKWQAAVEIAVEMLARRGDCYDQPAAMRVRKLIHPDLSIIFPMPAPKKEKDKESDKSDERLEFITHFRESKVANPFLPVDFGRISNILKDSVREFQDHLYKSPVEGGYRVAIFERAETMPRSSFDILLKTIEEPPPDSLLMILTDNFERLPETIRSRCQKIRFPRVSPAFLREYLMKEKQAKEDYAELICALSSGSISQAEKLLGSGFFEERDTAVMLLGYLLSHPLESFWTEFMGLINLRDRTTVENLLSIWQTLYHDIAVLLSNAGEHYLINKDQGKALRKLAAKIENFENARLGLGNLLSLQKLFYRNLSPMTALFEIAERLKSNLPALEVRD